MVWVLGLAAIVAVVLLVIMLVPARLAYSEAIVVGAPVADVYDRIRLQERLMRWSAWPSETGSACACEGHDGSVGARTVFYTRKGARFGHQEIVELAPNRRVVLELESKGPPQRPVLTFELEPAGADGTRVVLHFVNHISRPFNVLLRLFGIVR